MPDTIRDGRGSGRLLYIDDENRAVVSATVTPIAGHVAEEHGDTYIFTTGSEPFTLNSADTWHMCLDLKNIDTSKVMVGANISVSWNGGDTTGDKILWVRQRALHTITANYSASTITNTNFTSNNVAQVEYNVWDEVGNGITYTGGGAGGAFAVRKGRYDLNLFDSYIFGLNDYVGMEVKSSEVGKFTIGAMVYFKTP